MAVFFLVQHFAMAQTCMHCCWKKWLWSLQTIDDSRHELNHAEPSSSSSKWQRFEERMINETSVDTIASSKHLSAP